MCCYKCAWVTPMKLPSQRTQASCWHLFVSTLYSPVLLACHWNQHGINGYNSILATNENLDVVCRRGAAASAALGIVPGEKPGQGNADQLPCWQPPDHHFPASSINSHLHTMCDCLQLSLEYKLAQLPEAATAVNHTCCIACPATNFPWLLLAAFSHK